MNGKRKSVRGKKEGTLLALALSVSVMFGNSMTAEAANHTLYEHQHLSKGDELQGGDVIQVMSNYNLRIIIDGDTVNIENVSGLLGYQLPSGKNYIVTDFQYGRTGISLNIEFRVTLQSYVPADSGNTSNKPNTPPTNNIKEDNTEDDSAENQNPAASYYQSDAHEHSFSWVTVQEAGAGQDGLEEYRCACGLVEGRNTIPGSQAAVSQLKDMIESAPAGEKISFDTGRLYTLSDSIIQKLAERNDVSAEITFEYQGKNYKMTIPAGADYTAILGDEENFYGYFYFAQLIGATIEEI